MSFKRNVQQRLFFFLLFSCLLPFSSPRADDVLPFPEPKDWRELPESALIETNIGSFEISFYRKEAPISVRNFQYLAENGKYNNVKFHYFVEGFIIQGGDMTGTGKGGPGYTLPPEISKIKHSVGAIGWARLPNQVNLERRSNGSQFYISLNTNRHLNGFYTLFAHISQGMETVRHLRVGDSIVRIRFPKDFLARKNSPPDSNARPLPTAPEPPKDLPKNGRLENGDSFALPVN